MQCHHFDLSDFDCEENTNVPRVRHGGELRERLYTTVCVDGAQAGVGGVDSWGSLPLIKYRLTLKGPIEWTFAMQPFGTRQVTKLPSLLEKTRRLREREILDSPRVGRRPESLSLSEQGAGSEAGEAVPPAAAATRAVYDRDPDLSRAPTPPPPSPTRDRSQTPPPPEALELKEPTVLARALRLRLAPDTALARPFGRDGGGGTRPSSPSQVRPQRELSGLTALFPQISPLLDAVASSFQTPPSATPIDSPPVSRQNSNSWEEP